MGAELLIITNKSPFLPQKGLYYELRFFALRPLGSKKIIKNVEEGGENFL